MPKRNYPEQRSTTASPQPGQAPAQPSGDEVYRSRPAGQTGEGAAGKMTAEEMAELEELRGAAAEAYERLEATAGLVSERANQTFETGRAYVRENPLGVTLGAFAVGVVLGIVSSR